MKNTKSLFAAIGMAFTMLLSSCSLLPQLPTKSNNSFNSSSEDISDSRTNSHSFSSHQHEWGEWRVSEEATCSKDGKEIRICTGCKAVETRGIPALGHDFVSYPSDSIDPYYVAPTADADGQRSRYCSRCGEIEIVVIPHGQSNTSITIDQAEIIKDEGTETVYLRMHGTYIGYTRANNFKWAFGLQEATGTAVGTSSGEFVYGSANPSDSDFIYTPDDLDIINSIYHISIPLNKLDFASPLDGPYRVYTGPKGHYGAYQVSIIDNTNYLDSDYRYYLRNDGALGSYLNVCYDRLPPFAFNDATIEFVDNGAGENDTWVKIYGPANDQSKPIGTLLSELSANDVFVQFQTGSSTYFTPGRYDISYYFDVYNDNGVNIAAIYIKINFMLGRSNATYNTHLNVLAYKQLNCVMNKDFSHIYEVPGLDKRIEVFSNHAGPADKENSYGNLGFRVMNKQLSLFGEWIGESMDYVRDSIEWTDKEWSDGIKGFKFNKTNCGFNLVFNPTISAYFHLELLIAVKYPNRETTGFWKQGYTEKTAVYFNGDKQPTPEKDLVFTDVTESTVDDNGGKLSEPLWYDVGLLNLYSRVNEDNNLRVEYLGGGYSYYICGARLTIMM